MCDLLYKDNSFHFDNKCLIAFDRLKKELTLAHIVTSSELPLPFELMCNASDCAVGVVLEQRWEGRLHVIYCASKLPHKVQLNYATMAKSY